MKIYKKQINSDKMNEIMQTNLKRKISEKSETQRIKPYWIHEKEQSNNFLNQKVLNKEKNQHYIQEKIIQEKKEIKLKTSRDYINTEEKQKQQNIDAKGNIKLQQIENLLTEFKIKFAKIQQKYSLPIKSEHTDLTFQIPISPQAHSCSSKLNKISDNKFFNGYFTPTLNTSNLGSNYQQTFTSLSQHPIWTSNNKNLGSSCAKTKNYLSKFETNSPTADTRTQDKSKFRATYGPSKCNMITVPVRKIKQAQQAISNRYNFSKCKDVQSQTQDNDQQQTKQSIVIQKFSFNWRKLKRTQTLNQVLQQKSSSKKAQQYLKRMGSLGRNA